MESLVTRNPLLLLYSAVTLPIITMAILVASTIHIQLVNSPYN
ncbi:MAG: hypothetical protein RBR13_07275 [Tenuifilaceae bacterium]|nr:hypothetical protein [Tenuifilaceae bacterium]